QVGEARSPVLARRRGSAGRGAGRAGDRCLSRRGTPDRMSVAMAAPVRSTRIAAIDWMRGFVMVLMVVDHASMAFDGTHNPLDSAMYPDAMTAPLPAAECLTRWIPHICAPTFVFLAGMSLALSIERKVAKGVPAW